MLTLISEIRKGGNPSRVYLDFWCRAFDLGFLEIRGEADCAYSAGYFGPRAVRTWRTHVRDLEKLGFIETAEKGNLKYGYILLLNPYKVATTLKDKEKVPKRWWNAFSSRAEESGAALDEHTA